ncbi:MAG: peptide ABC transporter substrate-binding protein [Simkaniaceae bacterium]|nr:peptide ABC transporter substrate-binding protein [Candidatus Sacchlamyda saccharinae]
MGKWKILILAALLGCGAPEEGAQYVRINLGSEPQTTDPRKARDPNAQTLVRMFFDGLTRIGPNDEPQLALASNIEVSRDGKTYTFTLREAKWSNGQLVRAQDFAYAWRTTLSPDFVTDNAYQLYLIKNAQGVKEGKLPADELGIHTPDEKKLVLELEYPVPYLLELLATPYFYPIHEETDRNSPNWSEHPESYVGNGPFLFRKWRHQDQITVDKNPSYWDCSSVGLEGLILTMVDGDTEMMLFEKSDLDWCGSPLSLIPVDAMDHLDDLESSPRDETAFLRANTEKVPLPLRRALCLAVDRDMLTEHVAKGQLPARRLVPPSMQLQEAPYFHEGEVKNLTLEEVPPLRLTYSNSERAHLIAQTLQQQWLSSLGIKIELEGVERKVFFDRISKQDYDLAYCSWGADFHDPVNFLEVFKSKSQSTNNTNWEDVTYTQGLNDSNLLLDPHQRKEKLSQCEKILLEAMPIIPLFHYSMFYRKAENLQGVFLSSMGSLDFKWARLENDH